MVTLKDIAAEAGVSITTVSNVVHNRKSRVSEKKVAKIWEIIEREHYVPSMSARSLANDQSAIIAMVTYITPRTTGSTVSDPFMSSVAASVEQRTREAGYYLMLRSAESVAALEGLIHSWRLSGLIMTGLFQDSFFDAVAKLGIPVVLIDSYVDDPNICCVGLEDEKGGYLATKHLLENGHRVIAFASPPISPAGVIELRLQGYRRALAEYGVPYYPNVTMGWDPSPRYVEQTPEGIKNYLVTYTIGNNTPENFREALQRTKDRLLADPNGPRILNINSWNEWTEGSYIEPDSIHGTGYLEAIKAVFGQAAPTAAE